jgi:hypothetical protein
MKLDKLKKENDGRSIVDIEQEIKNNQLRNRATMIRMVELLYYLDRTRRFKENEGYKNSQWDHYLLDFYGMRPHTYIKYRNAILRQRKKVEEHGVGLVAKIWDVCDKPEKAIKEIDKLKTSGVQWRQKVEEIIEKHRKPKPVRIQAPALSQDEMDRLREIIREQRTEIKELRDQNEKLKRTVIEQKTELTKLEKIKKLISPESDVA